MSSMKNGSPEFLTGARHFQFSQILDEETLSLLYLHLYYLYIFFTTSRDCTAFTKVKMLSEAVLT